jgi:lipoate-protein ligase B
MYLGWGTLWKRRRNRTAAAMAANTVKILRLGQVKYRSAYQVQEHLVNIVKGGAGRTEPSPNFLILLQHTPVYTTGIRTKEYSKDEETYLRSLGADFVRTNRGGLITFHGPGQLVAYPILNLNNFIPQTSRRKAVLGMRWYVNTLEEVVIKVVSEFGLLGTRSPHTGVWLGENKVCAMGVHSSQLVTSHGIALNCNVDLEWFNKIVPCGIVGKGVTSLSRELNQETRIQDVHPVLITHFGEQFSAQMEECSRSELDKFLPPELNLTPELNPSPDPDS